MEIRLFQLLVPFIAFLFVAAVATRYLKGKINLSEFLLSLIFWAALGVFAIFPDAISVFVAKLFGIKDNVNAVIFLSIGIILYLLFKLYSEMKDNRRKLTLLTRKIALKDAEELEDL